MSTKVRKHKFRAEVQQLLDLMIHSLYSNKDIFLRELISNSSDALDRLRFEGVTTPHLLPAGELRIKLEVDAKARTLAVHDNGIGMTRDEVVQNIGTIARSGTQEFLAAARERKDANLASELIGQFGVGFYSSFMVADRVSLVTRRAGETTASRWESAGDGSYSLGDAERDEPGTSVILSLKPLDEENGIKDYTEEWVLRSIVKHYSDFVSYPIKLDVERTEVEKDAEGKPVEGGKEQTRVEEQTLNSMKAIWTRPESDVDEEEYKEFYKHISHDWNDPLKRIAVTMEGRFEARALLFIPSQAPLDLYLPDRAHRGIQLYVKRVFIMDDCRELLPDYLRFMKGVVDSEDLSLNVSREILQQDRQILTIRKFLVKRIVDNLQTMKKEQIETYRGFWSQFGAVLKEGLAGPEEKKEQLLGLLLAQSTLDEAAPVSLDDYIEKMKDGQETIYYLTGASREEVERSPHLESLKTKGYGVLYFTDPIDELWLQGAGEYKGKKFQSAGKGEIEIGTEDEKKEAAEAKKEKEKNYQGLLECLRAHLKDEVKEVRLSSRLTDSPACLVGDFNEMSPQLEEILKRMGQDVPKPKRVLEVNPSHPLLAKLQQIHQEDATAPHLESFAKLLYGQAILAEGRKPADPASFSKLVADLMLKSLK